MAGFLLMKCHFHSPVKPVSSMNFAHSLFFAVEYVWISDAVPVTSEKKGIPVSITVEQIACKKDFTGCFGDNARLKSSVLKVVNS